MHLLYRLVALLAFVASVLGCDHPHRSFTQRTTANGVDLLDSQVDITAGRIRFQCRASQSGQCHYTLFAHVCDAGADCREPPLKQVSVTAGREHVIPHLPATVQVCARTDNASVDSHCRPLAPAS